MDLNRTVLVVTDLDGLLFGATADVLQEAADSLRSLSERGIAIVVCSSRTRTEIEFLQQKLGTVAPFISENGGALFLPRGFSPGWPAGGRQSLAYDVIEFAPRSDVVVETLRATSHRVRAELVGFSEMSIDEIAAACGLSLADARLAKSREYSERFRLLTERGSTRRRLFSALHLAGLTCSSHGPFHFATGVRDQAQSLQMLLSLYAHAAGRFLTIGLVGTSHDAWVLREVDIPIVLQTDKIGTGVAAADRNQPAGMSANGSRTWREVVASVLSRSGLI